MSEFFISLEDVDLYYKITHEGEEVYMSQDGCHAEYKYNDNIYIITIDNFGYVTIQMKGDDIDEI